MLPAIGVALAGIAVAFFDYGRKSAPQTGFLALAKPLQTLFEKGWYLDAIYNRVFVGLTQATAGLLFGIEGKGFDGASDGIGKSTVVAGGVAAKSQSGRLQLYIGTAIVLVAGACLAIALGGAS